MTVWTGIWLDSPNGLCYILGGIDFNWFAPDEFFIP